MIRSLIAAGAALAAVALAPLAHADSHGYYQYLVSHDVIGDGPGQYSAESIVAEGNYACTAFQQGSSDQSVLNQLEAQFATSAADAIVYAAHHYLCP
jgi:hypothetical protein